MHRSVVILLAASLTLIPTVMSDGSAHLSAKRDPCLSSSEEGFVDPTGCRMGHFGPFVLTACSGSRCTLQLDDVVSYVAHRFVTSVREPLSQNQPTRSTLDVSVTLGGPAGTTHQLCHREELVGQGALTCTVRRSLTWELEPTGCTGGGYATAHTGVGTAFVVGSTMVGEFEACRVGSTYAFAITNGGGWS